jgi:hypothetical protein
MAKNNIVAKTGNFIEQNKMPLLYIGGAIVALFIIVPVVKRIRGILNPDEGKATDTKAVVKNVSVNKSNATFSENEARIMANQLVGYMSVTTGTDEKGIQSVFEKVKNADDMKLLYVTFGTRPYSYINQGEASGLLFGILEKAGGFAQLDLIGWLEQELGIFDWKTKRIVNEKLNLMGASIR